jgi:hypothetical protein
MNQRTERPLLMSYKTIPSTKRPQTIHSASWRRGTIINWLILCTIKEASRAIAEAGRYHLGWGVREQAAEADEISLLEKDGMFPNHAGATHFSIDVNVSKNRKS